MRQSNFIHLPTDRLASLSDTLDNLLNHKKAGHALPECYGDDIGTKTWATFTRLSNPSIQYTFGSEVSAIKNGLNEMISIIRNDQDLDLSNLVVVEKGNGDTRAMHEKSFRILRGLSKQGVYTGLYSGWDGAEEYRVSGDGYARNQLPDAEINMRDADFNKDDPDISTRKMKNTDAPRLVMEFGSSRGNIATSPSKNKSFQEQTYEELRFRFRHDRQICRDGGMLIVGTDSNNTPSAKTAYTHPAHAKFAENIIHRGLREGAMSASFEPQLMYYDPIWDANDHVVRHTLFAGSSQQTGILGASGTFNACSIKEGDGFVLSHSIKWPTDKIISAAEQEGFKCMGVFWGDDQRVPVYIFKAISLKPDIKLVM
jgi:hypothetical protein